MRIKILVGISFYLGSRTSLEKIEVYPFMGLVDLVEKQVDIASVVWKGAWRKCGPSCGKFLFRDQQIQAAVGDVQCDPISILYQC
jgi:hypothetical protein